MAKFIAFYMVQGTSLPFIGLPFQVGSSSDPDSYMRDDIVRIAEIMAPNGFTYVDVEPAYDQ